MTSARQRFLRPAVRERRPESVRPRPYLSKRRGDVADFSYQQPPEFLNLGSEPMQAFGFKGW